MGLDYSANVNSHLNIFCKASLIVNGNELSPQYLLCNDESNLVLPRELTQSTASFFSSLLSIDSEIYGNRNDVGAFNLGSYADSLKDSGVLSNEFLSLGTGNTDGVSTSNKTPFAIKIYRMSDSDISTAMNYFSGFDLADGQKDFPVDYYQILKPYVGVKNDFFEGLGFIRAVDTGDYILIRGVKYS